MTPMLSMRAPTESDGTGGIAGNPEALGAMRLALEDAMATGCGTVQALSPNGSPLILVFIRDRDMGALRCDSNDATTASAAANDHVAAQALRSWIATHLPGASLGPAYQDAQLVPRRPLTD
ncbi:hypothetical protein IP91_00349 [Pseudoduganella lurida]|uniref:Uncharacterized protein n=2 Tax=Pseudoduganella lurida TaxID=1036180 RepID=A0A562RJP3_9BURK|nr:hypothetical protein IP91_00349 [Pseudoduganella lurida]